MLLSGANYGSGHEPIVERDRPRKYNLHSEARRRSRAEVYWEMSNSGGLSRKNVSPGADSSSGAPVTLGRTILLKQLPLTSVVLLIAISVGVVAAERVPPAGPNIVPPTPEWEAGVQKAAPAQPTVAAAKRKVLVFSRFTGYDHKVIPHVDRVLQILASKSGAFDVTIAVDIEALTPENLAPYDVLVLNNNCSKGDRRELFLDVLESEAKYRDLTEAQRKAKAQALEQSMLDFVAGGKGLVAIHGAVTFLNNSPKYTEMIGAAFDYHPPSQEVTVHTVDANHPLVAAFRGKEPFIHKDEPYLFCGPYTKTNFRPLLVIDTKSLRDPKGKATAMTRYVAWIKPWGKGRVMFCSPSHFPESYLSPTLLRFLLDGIQYAAGDLKCDDSPQTNSGRKGA